jgi:hypothetical protein
VAKLGKVQEEIVAALRRGLRLVYATGSMASGTRDAVTIRAWESARFYEDTDGGRVAAPVRAPVASVKRLVDRGVLRYDGKWPRLSCFDERREVELFLVPDAVSGDHG